MPFFLRHYSTVACKIFVQDCGSTDKTRDIVRENGAVLVEDEPWGMDEDRRRNESEIFVRECQGKTEWCLCVDADEFVVGDFESAMESANEGGFDVIHTIGCTMMGPQFPKDDGRQIYDIAQTGVISGASKPCMVRPGTNFRWSLGRHFIESKDTKVAPPKDLFLLHYRFMGLEYTESRHARNWERSPDKGTAWCCSPEWTGDCSVEWMKKHGDNYGENVVRWIRDRVPIKPIYGPFPPHLPERNEAVLKSVE